MRVCPRCASETEHEVCPTDGTQTVSVNDDRRTYELGTVIGSRYRIDDVIGIGGFGAVYRCTNLAMQQTVAVKVLRTEHLSSVEHVKRFSREAQAVSRLKHPNTIHTFDFGTHTDGALYLAMEFLEGETLADRIDQKRSLYWETAVHIAVQACHSLTEAHGHGLVHRDLKPENFMLMPVAGDPNFLKVLDFGIAKLQTDPTSPRQSNLTESGMIMGTPTYMSPEQAKGESIDGRSDVYALGVMLYEMLTGNAPFDDETAMKILVAHINMPPKPFFRSGGPDDVPFEVERVVMQCLEKDPSRRPQTTVQLVDRLVSATRKAREPAEARAREADLTASSGADGLSGATVQLARSEVAALAGSVQHVFGSASSSSTGIAQFVHPTGPLPAHANRQHLQVIPDRTGYFVAAGALAAVVLGVGVALSLGDPAREQAPTVPVAAPFRADVRSPAGPGPAAGALAPTVAGAPAAAKLAGTPVVGQPLAVNPSIVQGVPPPGGQPQAPAPGVAAGEGPARPAEVGSAAGRQPAVAALGNSGKIEAAKVRPAGAGASVGAPAGALTPQPAKAEARAAAERAAAAKASAEKAALDKALKEKAAEEKANHDKAAADKANAEKATAAKPEGSKGGKDDFRLDDDNK
ncbi:MAG: serine/threonine protein kinase [Myxococcales bacterium]|nr:serine/threonine protein kinase [Myxococcales bacterium]